MSIKTHWHICECGTAWEHANNLADVLDSRQYRDAHTCPDCGFEGRPTRIKYDQLEVRLLAVRYGRNKVA